jgi:PST family polysaccharide transporter
MCEEDPQQVNQESSPAELRSASVKDLKHRATRGGVARILSQASMLVLRTGTLMVMARLLDPTDFGLIGMVTAVIGVFSVFRDFGLSAAAIQQTNITAEQSSTLFWINMFVGVFLGALAALMGPFVADFYHQPRLIGITAVLATGFIFNSAGVQHSALLERQMRFVVLSVLDVGSLAIATIIGIVMALKGFGYWALVITSTVTPMLYMFGVWFVSGWVPGRPRRGVGVGSMMKFGGSLTANGLVMYFAKNFDKILLGKFWGVDALGIYGRAYQLVNIPTANLNSAAGGVVFAALSRVQDDAARFRSYFVKGYSLILSLAVPITFMCALFGDDIIRVFLGPKWHSAIPIFRCLAPTTLGFAIFTPLGGLLAARGLVDRSLKMALVLAPLLMTGYVVGLHWGPVGVAIAYSTVIMTAVFPMIGWAVRDTGVSFRDLLETLARPMIAGVVAAAPAYGVGLWCGSAMLPVARLAATLTTLSIVYVVMLLYALGQKQFYFDIARTLFKRMPAEEASGLSI